MPVIVSPLFWEWFNIWLVQFLKDLYHEIKMVALRGGNSSLNTVNHNCVHGGQGVDGHNIPPLGMQHGNGHQSLGHHSNHNHSQPNVQTLNSISVQFVPPQNPSALKHEQNPRYSSSNCMQPSHHYRLLTQTRPECYHPSGASGNYIPNATGGQNTAQGLRGQAAPQPSAPPAPQPDMSKTTMAGPTYISTPNQQLGRPQLANYQYRAPQHGTRPASHPRQQQQYLSGAGATAAGPVMIPHPALMYQHPHMGIQQSYQPQRPSTSGYFPLIHPSQLYHSTPSPGPYYYQNGQQLSAGTVGTNPGRSNLGGLVPQQVTAPATPATPITHPTQPHIHPNISGIRQAPVNRPSKRIAIIDPKTNQNILEEMSRSESQRNDGEKSERQTPQPDNKQSVAEEFTRLVHERMAEPPSTCDSDSKWTCTNTNEVPAATTAPNQPHTNAINTMSNSLVKSDLVNANETKNLGPEINEPIETPIVSAISDSPVVVPKMSNVKQHQKCSEQPPLVDSKSAGKQKKSKPFVPQDETNVLVQSQPTSAAPVTNEPFVTSHAQITGAAYDSGVAQSSSSLLLNCAPQPQRVRGERRVSRDKTHDVEKSGLKEAEEKPNGPTSVEISSVDSVTETINTPTSPVNQSLETSKVVKPQVTETEKPNLDRKPEVVIKEPTFPTKQLPTATELLSASIEKVAKEQPIPEEINVKKEDSSAIQAQAKLAHSIANVTRNHSEPKMKDINLNNKPADSDTANGNTTVETVKEETNKNEKAVKNAKNHNKKSNKMANNEVKETKAESYENGKDETDKISKPEQENVPPKEETEEPTEKPTADEKPAAFVPKYNYSEDQWSPLNKAGKKHYDINLLMQIKDDPLCKNKPNVPLLEACNVMRTTPIQEHNMIFSPITRPMNDAFYPNFLKVSGSAPRNNVMKEPKKDGRSMPQGGKGSAKLTPSGGGGHKPVIHVSLSLREEVKLNQTKDAWRPARFKKESLTEEEAKTQEVYKKFRGILNKLTPQKFDTLLERVKSLEINTKSRLEGVIDLIFEKAIDEPNFSEAYAAMCNKLSMIKVPVTNSTAPDQYVNFRILIINRCQNQFENVKVDETVQRLEKEVAECTDAVKKKELQQQIEEENRRIRMRSVGNVRFIGELYKLKMLTAKIMFFCMNHLIDKLEEEKLECLCKLLTTIGQQVESETKDQLEAVFKKMQDIVDRKSDKISSRVRFMIQDVIELKRRKWVTKNVVDSQPKMMDQIQKEAEQQQRNIELMNSSPMGFRREDGGRNKRSDGRRQPFNDAWKATRTIYTVDTNKLKAVTQKSNMNTIKLAPHNSWIQGSGTKNTPQASSASMISLTKNNKFSVLEHAQTDPSTLRTTKDLSSSYHHSKSIERSTFNSRGDFNNGSGSRPSSTAATRSNSGSRSLSAATPPATETPPTSVPQEPLPEKKINSIKMTVMEHLENPTQNDEAVQDIQEFAPQYHASIVTEILKVAIGMPEKKAVIIVKLLADIVCKNVISPENFVAGLKEIMSGAPDLKYDVPMLYEYLGKLIAPQIEKKYMTFEQVLSICDIIIQAEEGHLILTVILRELKDSMGPTFVKTKWSESGLKLSQWMSDEEVPKWIEDNKFEFLEGGATTEETSKILSPSMTQTKLLQLMNSEESCETIQGWIKDNLGASSSEDWFLRALSQTICEYALYGSDNRGAPHFSLERMNKYSPLIMNELSESKVERETSCLFGIQQLIHRLEHPQGLTLEIFQFLHEQYIISVEGFIAWEESEKEPEGKAVMLKALTSFFTSIKEADNEDSCGDD